MVPLIRDATIPAIGILLLFGCAFLAGCQTPSTGFCSVAKPHRHSDSTIAVMTDAEVRQELAHNQTGSKLCGWRQ